MQVSNDEGGTLCLDAIGAAQAAGGTRGARDARDARRAEGIPQRDRAGRPVAFTAKCVQRRIGKPKGGRAQQPHQGEIVGWVGQCVQHVEQVTYLGAAVEPAPGHGQKRYRGPLQRILVGRKGTRGAAEDREIAVIQRPSTARIVADPGTADYQFHDTPGQRTGGPIQRTIRLGAGHEMQFDMGRCQAGAGLLAVVQEGGKGLYPRAGGILVHPQHRPEQLVQPLDQFAVGAVGGVQG